MNRLEFKQIFELATKYPWLIERQEALEDMLFQDCKNDDERNLVTKLIRNFKYVSWEEFSAGILSLAEAIVRSEKINAQPSEVIISAMAQDGSPDSSQALLQFIKMHFQNMGWKDVIYVNKIGDIFQAQKKYDFKRRKIIILDDFLGSGKTALSKVKFLENLAYPKDFHNEVFFGFLYGSVVGVEALKSVGVKFEILHTINRALSDQDDKSEAAKDVELMLGLEGNLAAIYGSHKIDECSLGYGKVESLFAIQNSSIPNSVFPIFWWGKNDKDEDRRVFFTRFVS
jgi:hypothetical protein